MILLCTKNDKTKYNFFRNSTLFVFDNGFRFVEIENVLHYRKMFKMYALNTVRPDRVDLRETPCVLRENNRT